MTSKKKILIIEDEPHIVLGLTDALEFEGFAVVSAGTGGAGVQLAKQEKPEAVLLDLMLPDTNGFKVCEELRRLDAFVPIIILTARGQEVDKIRGLDAGADDFLAKPFELVELEARLRALLRRGQGEWIEFGSCRWEIKGRKLYLHEQPVSLSARETVLLELLLHNRNRVVSKERILDTLTGWSGEIGINAVEVYIHRLRRKLEPGNAAIRTVRGLGYLLEGGGAV